VTPVLSVVKAFEVLAENHE